MYQRSSVNCSESSFEFVETPAAPAFSFEKTEDYGVRTTKYPSVKNAPLPADGAGSDSFSNIALFSLLFGIPCYLSWNFSGGLSTAVFLGFFTSAPIVVVFWLVASSISARKKEKARFPGRPMEHYLNFKKGADKLKYRGRNKIPMETFHEMYLDGDVEFNGNALDVLEYRHDWAAFRFTINSSSSNLLPGPPCTSVLRVRDHYDRGDDFYGWFLGPRMMYTSGIISDINKEETLEALQDNKLAVVCENIGLEQGDTVLDIGCGWGTLARFASVCYGACVTGITLGRNQTAWCNGALRKAGIHEDRSKIICMDYRDIPSVEGGYKKITCLEMAEHVGVRRFRSFLRQVYDMLDDDGVFFLQITGLRKYW